MTPVLVWTAEDGRPQGLVETDRPHAWTAEEFRAEAEDLDLALDGVLDRAIAHVNALSGEASSGDAFLRAWAIGKSLNDSDVYRLDAMQGERPDRLWKALASKIRVGVRAGGKPESTWQELRPSLDRQPRREGGRL